MAELGGEQFSQCYASTPKDRWPVRRALWDAHTPAVRAVLVLERHIRQQRMWFSAADGLQPQSGPARGGMVIARDCVGNSSQHDVFLVFPT